MLPMTCCHPLRALHCTNAAGFNLPLSLFRSRSRALALSLSFSVFPFFFSFLCSLSGYCHSLLVADLIRQSVSSLSSLSFASFSLFLSPSLSPSPIFSFRPLRPLSRTVSCLPINPSVSCCFCPERLSVFVLRP